MKRLHLAGASPPQHRRIVALNVVLGIRATDRSHGGGLVASKLTAASHGSHGCGAAPRTTLPPGIISGGRTGIGQRTTTHHRATACIAIPPGNNGATTVRSGRKDYGLGAHHC